MVAAAVGVARVGQQDIGRADVVNAPALKAGRGPLAGGVERHAIGQHPPAEFGGC